jgi:hypothetical protein
LVAFLLLGINVKAAGPPDQLCDASGSTGWTTVIRQNPHFTTQTFTPQQNRLSRVVLDMLGDGVGSAALAIFHDDALIALNTNDMVAEPNGRGDMGFNFNDITLVPNDVYQIFPIYSYGNTSLGWYWNYNCYSGGTAYVGSSVQDNDFGFATYGFTIPDPTPTPTPTPTATPSGSPTPTPSATPTPTPTLTTSQTLVPSTLSYVVKNNLIINDFINGIEATSNDILILNGTGVAGSTVVIDFNGTTYEAIVEQGGTWFLQLQLVELATGDYTITSQTKSGTEISESADLLVINFTSINTPTITTTTKENDWKLYLYIGAAVIVLGSLVVYYFIKKRKSGQPIASKVDSVITPETSVATPNEEEPPTEAPTDETPPTDSKPE